MTDAQWRAERPRLQPLAFDAEGNMKTGDAELDEMLRDIADEADRG